MLSISWKCTNIDGIRHAYLAEDKSATETRLCTKVEKEKITMHSAFARGDKLCEVCKKRADAIIKKIPKKDLKIYLAEIVTEKPSSGCL